MSDDLKPIGSCHLIALSDANDVQREAVQTIVKTHAKSWWHERPDLWIAEGHSPPYWRDLIMPVLALSPATVTVFQLPEPGGRAWATHGLRNLTWLHESYSGKPTPSKAKALSAPRPAPPDDDIPF